jgi:hypothetical protein
VERRVGEQRRELALVLQPEGLEREARAGQLRMHVIRWPRFVARSIFLPFRSHPYLTSLYPAKAFAGLLLRAHLSRARDRSS